MWRNDDHDDSEFDDYIYIYIYTYEESNRLAETRLAQNTFNHIQIAWITLKLLIAQYILSKITTPTPTTEPPVWNMLGAP